MRGAAPTVAGTEWDGEAWAAERTKTASAPAVVARVDGTVVAASAAAQAWMTHGHLASAVQALVIDARLKGRTVTARVSLQEKGAPDVVRRYDLVLLPLPAGDVLVVGRDTTLESNLLTALAASRELFRDLALCFNDFAFETDAAGVFTWASPEGVLGYTSDELHGARVRDVFGELHPNPLSSRQAVRACEVWLNAKSGGDACISVTASPVLNAQGAWCGTRGVVRDVTAIKAQEREAVHARKREELIAAVVNAVRAQVEPRRMMLAAADALAGATESDFVSIKALGSELSVNVGGGGSADVALEGATGYQGKENGRIHLARESGRDAYGDAERSLFDAILPHLGIAIALAQSLETGALSRSDALTGLLNRRAFVTEAKRRFGAAARAGRAVALLAVACDNLGDVNAALGRARGDELLSAVGRSLLRICDGGLAGRLSGGGFAVLVDDVRNAVQIGEAVRKSIADLKNDLGLVAGVTASVGVAVVEPEAADDFEEVMGRAERALQAAKREGGDRVALAETVQEGASC